MQTYKVKTGIFKGTIFNGTELNGRIINNDTTGTVIRQIFGDSNRNAEHYRTGSENKIRTIYCTTVGNIIKIRLE